MRVNVGLGVLVITHFAFGMLFDIPYIMLWLCGGGGGVCLLFEAERKVPRRLKRRQTALHLASGLQQVVLHEYEGNHTT